ncbi:acyl carrier protein [Wolbachia endosymbiont of Pentidionis agamae]|uniref:acyl carrier protein n=1 Tax=Wolbachia endosymbiont of Pentidionis agamae TaxID=3110435 RepID=UPI002FD60BF5
MNIDYTKEKVEEELKEIILKSTKKVTELERSFTFDGNLEIDSLEIVEMIMDIESHFCIEIPDEDVQKMKNVGDVFDYVTAKKLQSQCIEE